MAAAVWVLLRADAQLEYVRSVVQIGCKHHCARVMQITAKVVLQLDLFHLRAIYADLQVARIRPSQQISTNRAATERKGQFRADLLSTKKLPLEKTCATIPGDFSPSGDFYFPILTQPRICRTD